MSQIAKLTDVILRLLDGASWPPCLNNNLPTNLFSMFLLIGLCPENLFASATSMLVNIKTITSVSLSITSGSGLTFLTIYKFSSNINDFVSLIEFE